MALARDLVQPVQSIQEDLAQDDNLEAVVSKVFGAGQQALQDVGNALGLEQMAKAVSAMPLADLTAIEIFTGVIERHRRCGRQRKRCADCRRVLLRSYVANVHFYGASPGRRRSRANRVPIGIPPRLLVRFQRS